MAQRNVGGTWTFRQSNGPIVQVHVPYMAPDGAFSGYARESDKTADIVEARVSGDDMVFTTPWSHGSIGKYFGRFGLDNRLTGFCYDITNPSSQATWVVTDREFPKP